MQHADVISKGRCQNYEGGQLYVARKRDNSRDEAITRVSTERLEHRFYLGVSMQVQQEVIPEIGTKNMTNEDKNQAAPTLPS